MSELNHRTPSLEEFSVYMQDSIAGPVPTAGTEKDTMTIHFGAAKVEWDVDAYYRSHGTTRPPTPTLSGAELREMCRGISPTNTLEYEGRAIGTREAFAIFDGVHFDLVPPASW